MPLNDLRAPVTEMSRDTIHLTKYHCQILTQEAFPRHKKGCCISYHRFVFIENTSVVYQNHQVFLTQLVIRRASLCTETPNDSSKTGKTAILKLLRSQN